MKNRQAAILTGMFLCMAAVTGCGSNTETQAAKQQGSEIEDTAAENTAAEGDDEKTDGKTEEQNKENQIFGKIVSVSEDSITISVESDSGKWNRRWKRKFRHRRDKEKNRLLLLQKIR